MIKKLLALACCIIIGASSFSQRYWIGVASTAWGTPANWSTSPAGPGGAAVPGPSDNVFFDRATPNPCILTTAATISIFQITNGSFSFGSSGALTVTSTFSMSGGNFSAGSGTLSVPSNTFTLSGGTLDAGSANFYFGNNLTISSPSSVIPGTSTVTFNGSGQQDVLAVSTSQAGTIVFYNLVVNKPGNSVLRFSTVGPPDTIQINNLLTLSAGQFLGNGFIKIEKDVVSQPGFGGSGIPIACTGPNPSIVTLGSQLAVAGVTNFVGIAKSSPDVTVSVYRGPGAPDDTIRIGNFDARFIVRRGIIQFPENPPIISRFRTIEIEPGGTLLCTSNFLYNVGEHINRGGTFIANGGTYVFSYPFIPNRTDFITNIENFNNLIIDNRTQFGPGANDTLVVNGNLIIRSGELQGDPGSAFNVKGNMIFEAGAAETAGVTNLIFSGTTDQTLSFATGKEGAWNGAVTINKPSGKLILQSPMIMNMFGGRLFTFTKGIVQTTAINYLLLTSEANVSGASIASYVDGPVQYRWYSDFTFPIGNNGVYAPVRVTGAGEETITAQYFSANPTALYNTALFAATLQNVSTKEYWMISKAGTGTFPYVWLSFENTRSGGVTDPSKLRVARWNGSLWADEGNGQLSANFVRTTNPLSSFSPFTLASTDKLLNSLPLHFTSFTANLVTNGALLEWTTETEINNSHFNIQRSGGGINFDNIGRVNAQTGGNLYKYIFTDNHMSNGKNFYRLQQVDLDGSIAYSKIISVTKSAPAAASFLTYPNPATNFVTVQSITLANKLVTLEILDMKGSLLQKHSVQLDGSGKWTIKQLPARGKYFLRVGFKDTSYRQVLVVQ